MPAPCPTAVDAFLTGYVRRRRRAAAGSAVGSAAALFLAWGLFACAVDRLSALSAVARLAWLVAGSAAAAAVVAPACLRLCRRGYDPVAAAAAVERACPAFDQRLVTVVSQPPLSPPSAMFDQLAADVAGLLADCRPPVARRRLAVAAACLGSTLAATAVLWHWPWLDLPRLAVRFAAPLAAVDPATTARPTVRPGDVAVVAGHALTVTATDAGPPAPGGAATLHVSDDAGRTWSDTPMRPADPAGRAFACELAAVDRDLLYRVTCGDATTPAYAVTALHPPAVVEYRVRYTPPAPVAAAATRPASATLVIPADGTVEVPAGAAVTLDVAATEPLRSASLVVNGSRVEAVTTPDPTVRRATFVARRGDRLDVRLTAASGMTAAGPRAAALRTVADRPPVARILEPTGDVQLAPRDVLVVHYQAADDHGLASVTLDVRVNGRRPTPTTVPVAGDDPSAGDRVCEGTATIPLAGRHLAAGDYVTVRVRAVDTAGQQTTSDACQVLIAPRAVDPDDRARAADLAAAAAVADELATDLDAAAAALAAAGRADGSPDARRAAAASADARLAAAAAPAAVLVDALLRGVQHANAAADATALAVLADDAAVCGATVGVATDGAAPPPATAARLAALADRRRRLRGWTRALADGAAAAVALGDRRGLAAATPAGPATGPTTVAAAATGNRFADAWNRAARGAAGAVAQLGLNPAGVRVDAELEARVAVAARVARDARPVDLAAAARDWANAPADAPYPTPVGRRLAVASEVEALRPRSDLAYAGDLRLAAAAAEAGPDRRAFAVAWAALQREHERPARAAAAGPSAAATVARAEMATWAAGGLAPGPGELAAAASAAVDRRDYDAADRLDDARRAAAVAGSPTPDARAADDRVRQLMRQVRTVDEIRADQDRLAAADGPADPDRQADLARRMSDVPRGSGESDAVEPTADEQVAAVAHAQAALTGLPGQLEKVRQRFEAAARARAAAREPAAGEAAGEMASAAVARLNEAVADATAAVGDRGRLAAVLRVVRDRAESGDAAGLTRALGDARGATESAQRELAEALEELLRRDPLTAATWYARDASAALAAAPPNLPAARRDQGRAVAALSEAWRQSAHRAAVDRLATVPELTRVFGRQPPTAGVAARPPIPDAAGPHEVDPPGYAEQLKAYFDALDRRTGPGHR